MRNDTKNELNNIDDSERQWCEGKGHSWTYGNLLVLAKRFIHVDKYSPGVGVVLKISEELEIRNSRQDATKNRSVEDMLSDLKATSVQSV